MENYENFTVEEKLKLEPFVTNTDRSIFVLTNLPEVIKGALFSRYSRSTLGIRTLLLKDFILSSESEFQEKTLGSPIRRIGYERWLRNLAIGLGNAPGCSNIIESLKARTVNCSEMLKEHLHWALEEQNRKLNN